MRARRMAARLTAVVVLAGPLAQTGTAVRAGAAEGETTTYGFTGTEQMYEIPHGAIALRIEAVGGNGAGGSLGAFVTAEVPVPDGLTRLYVAVAGDADGLWGGWNGGGSRLDGGRHRVGGGGASDVRTCGRDVEVCGAGTSLESRLLVAGGGGGLGVDGLPTALGGVGGDAGMDDGAGGDGVNGEDALPELGGTGGGGGSTSGPGAGGLGDGSAAEPGSFGAGADVLAGDSTAAWGGAGGGGWYGGGAGGLGGFTTQGPDGILRGGGGGGGAGSSYVHAGATSSTFVPEPVIEGDDSRTPLLANQVSITPIFTDPETSLEAAGLLGLRRSPFRATLRDAAGDPIGGKAVAFRVGSAVRCTATTNDAGVAACGTVVDLLRALVAGGYTASFVGDETHLASADRAGLFR